MSELVLDQVHSSNNLESLSAPSGQPAPPGMPADGDREVALRTWPLSHGQQALWYLHQLVPSSSGALNTVSTVHVRSPIDIAALRCALDRLSARHSVLRTTYSQVDGEPVQIVHAHLPIPLEQRDASAWSNEAVERYIDQEAHTAFDLEHESPMRITLLTRSADDHIAILKFHHIAIDLWSLVLISAELDALYTAQLAGGDPDLKPVANEYGNFVLEQRTMLASPAGEAHWAFWRDALAGPLAPLDLPVDRPRPALQTYDGSVVIRHLDTTLTDALRRLAAAQGAGLPTLVLSGFQALLHRYTAQDDILVGVLKAGRSARYARTVGYFVNTLVMRADLSQDPGFAALLAQVQAREQAAAPHEAFPFPLLVERLQLPRDPGRPALIQALFSWQKIPRQLDRQQATAFVLGEGGGALQLKGWQVESLPVRHRATHYELTLLAGESSEGLILALEYNTALFAPETAARLLGHLENLLRGTVATPDRPISQLPLMDEAERRAVLSVWSAVPTLSCPAAAPVPAAPDLIHRRFEAQAAAMPDAVAVMGPQGRRERQEEGTAEGLEELTYGELDRRANQLAHHLRGLGVGPESIVGLCVERSSAMIVGILGILKAGAAYLPLDPTYPADRIAYMLADSGAQVVVTQESMLRNSILRNNVLHTEDEEQRDTTARNTQYAIRNTQYILLDRDWPIIAQYPPVYQFTNLPSPDALAYVIYTSGSTGRPKGVAVTHANVTRLWDATQPWFHFGPEDVWTLFHSYAFDFSVWEMWGALLHGGRLVIVPYLTSRSPADFYRLLVEQQVTVLNQTPSAFRQLVDAEAALGVAPDLALRLIIFGGEALDFASLAAWFDRHGDERPQLVNMYGITETTVHVTYRPVRRADLGRTPGSMIGRPIPDLQLYALDRHGQPQPFGVPGELYVGGAGVSRGYLGRPDLTAERFVPNPFEVEVKAKAEAKVEAEAEEKAGQTSTSASTSTSNSRLYRTGDIGRVLANGDVVYLGRSDQQVKIRGHRIELGEIEGVLAEHPGVKEAVVLALPFGVPGSLSSSASDRSPRSTDDRRLVAYVVPRADSNLTAETLRRLAQARLPEVMVPAAFVFLEALPLTPNGKLDRRALPQPDWSQRLADAAFVAPRTPLEAQVAEIWAAVLGKETVGVLDNFFELGGHSLLAVQLLARLRQACGVELPLRDLFDAGTVAELARRIEALRSTNADRQAAVDAIEPRPATTEGPLSHGQLRLWFLSQLRPDSPLYNIPAAVRLTGPLDAAALERSLNVVVRRHASLRTVFRSQDGVPIQVVLPAVPIALAPEEVGPTALADGLAQRIMAQEARRPFHLDGPEADLPIRCRLLRLTPADHILLLTVHHIAADGWSLANLVRELAALYTAYSAPGASQQADDVVIAAAGLPPLPLQVLDYTRWQRRRTAALLDGDPATPPALQAAWAYWHQQLADLPPPLRLPTAMPQQPTADAVDRPTTGATVHFELPATLVDALIKLGRRYQSTLFTVLLAGFQALLYRYSSQNDFVVSTVVAERPWPELEPLIGFFVNTLPLRARLGEEAGDLPFADLLERVRQTTLEALEHQELPFELMVEAARNHVAETADRVPGGLTRLVFALQPDPAQLLHLPGIAVQPLEIDTGTAKFDLLLNLYQGPTGLRGALEFALDALDVETAERLVGHYRTLLESIAADSRQPLGALPLITAKERRQIVAAWNATATDYPRDTSLAELFEAQARATPNAVAVAMPLAGSLGESGDLQDLEELTYGELDRRSTQLAHCLRKLGMGPETVVGVLLERSVELVTAVVGIIKAGAAYLPLDPTFPAERIAFMLAESNVQVLVSATHVWERVTAEAVTTKDHTLGSDDFSRPRHIHTILLDRNGAIVAQHPTVPAESNSQPPANLPSVTCIPSPANLAYVIYTSGSTGTPKGIAVPQRAVVRLVRDTNYIQLTADDRVALASNVAFDAATFELWGALLNGSRLIIVPGSVLLNPSALANFLRRARITVLFVTTALFNQIAAEQPDTFASLRCLLFGGEAADPNAVRRVLHVGPPQQLLHVYGPTENTTFTTWYPVEEVSEDAITVPIGRPIANTQVYVVDRSLQPVPVLVPGELVIAGDGLARGYINRPDLTAERFVPNPFEVKVKAEAKAEENADQTSALAFTSTSSPRLYRTGDLVRQLPNGAIEFLGRLDTQVKLRGFRVELAEIEVVLCQHPAVAQAAVVLVSGLQGDKRLAAFLVPYKGAHVEPEQALVANLRRYLRSRLPEFMVPATLAVVDALPLAATGKVDRHRLAALAAELPPLPEDVAPSFEPPHSPLEELIAHIWQDLLGVAVISRRDNFFALGGHSLLAMQLISRVRQACQVELPVSAVFEAPTLAGLTARVEALLAPELSAETPAAGGELPAPPLEPLPAGAHAPLSFAQERLWFLSQLEPDTLTYHVPLAVRLRGPLNHAALAASLSAIVERHAVLRSTFELAPDGQPVLRVHEMVRLPLPLVDLRQVAATPAEIEAEARRLAIAEARHPFRLDRAPLIRCMLYRLAKDDHLLVVTAHHIACDGWSLAIILRELQHLYPRYAADPRAPVDLPPLPVQYADYAAWQRRWLSGETLERQLRYWRERLAGPVPPLHLPTDRPRPAVQTYRGGRHTFVVPADLARQLKTLSRHHNATLFMTLLAAFEVLLYRYTGQTDFAVGTPVANRRHCATEDLVGMFVNTLALRADLQGDPTFAELLARVRRTALEAYAHQDVPFERVVDALLHKEAEKATLPRDLSRSPLFQVLFALQNVPLGQLQLGDLSLTAEELEIGSVKFDLTLSLAEEGDVLRGWIGFNSDLFDVTTIERLAEHFCTLLAGIVQAPETPVSRLPLLPTAEAAQVLAWGVGPAAHPYVPVHRLIAQQAACTPERPAVLTVDGVALRYDELEACAEQLAHHLRRLGVGPDVPVALCLGRSPELIIALLGVLKAGGAYLPIDPAYPAERIVTMLADSAAPVVVSESQVWERVTTEVVTTKVHTLDSDGLSRLRLSHTVLLDRDWPVITQYPPGSTDGITQHLADLRPVICTPSPDALAYIIYTSGSSGEPKGVGITHGGLSNYARAAADMFELRPDDRVLQFAAISFDALVEEVFPALLRGSQVVLRNDEMIGSARRFLDTCAQLDITVLDLPTGYWAQLVAEMAAQELTLPPSVRLVILGGEAASPEHVRLWQRLVGPGVRLLNTYGPTEATVVATAAELTDLNPATVPIGRPVPGVSAYVLDHQGQPMPIGVPGELCIGGIGLARGYLGHPDLTAERFVPNPFEVKVKAEAKAEAEAEEKAGQTSTSASISTSRLYRTGDLVRWLPDGQLEFLGRLDRQVKVRGFRVEPGEVEAVLRQHPVVRDAIAVVRPVNGEPQLVAYVAIGHGRGNEGDDGLTAALHRFLAQRLPLHMLPAALIPVAAFPLTTSGKVDTAWLPVPDGVRNGLTMDYDAPRTPLEQALADLWQQVLGIERVGIHDNFFALGGNSLQAAILTNRLQQALNAVIYVVVLFDAPTVARLAAYLAQNYRRQVIAWLGEDAATLPENAPTPARITAAMVADLRSRITSHEPDDAEEAARLAQATAVGRNPPVVFILSAPRAGSTLLRVMLAGHPDLFSPPELALLSFHTLGERRRAFSGRDTGWLEGVWRALMEIHGCSLEEARRLMAALEDEDLPTPQFYARLQAWIAPRLLVDKTTTYALSLRTLRRAEAWFQDARYIHLVRNPTASVLSYLDSRLDPVFGHAYLYTPREKAELFWLIANQNIQRFFAEVPTSRRFTVHFEELVQRPEAIGRALCEFLGIPFHPALLEPYAGRRMLDGVHPASRMVGDPRFLERQAIEPEAARRWPALSPGDALSPLTLATAQALGYDDAPATPAAPDSSGSFEPSISGRAIAEELGGIKGTGETAGTSPLSFQQQRLWFLQQLEPESYAYNMPAALRLTGPLDVPALEEAFNGVIRRHAVLRATFRSVDGVPEQVIAPELRLTLTVEDLSQAVRGEDRAPARPEAIAAVIHPIAAAEAHRPFDLTTGPLLRARLLRLAPDDYILLFTMHHIVSDGWSTALLAQELSALYAAAIQGANQASALPPLPIQYTDYAAWQRQTLGDPGAPTETLARQLAYWREKLADLPPLLDLPARLGKERPPVKGAAGASVALDLPADLADALRELGQHEDATLFMTLLAAFEVLLSRYAGQDDFAVGTVLAGRTRAELESLIGFFANTLPIRADIAARDGDDRPTFRELLRRVRRTVLEAFNHQDAPFEALVEMLQLQRNLSHTPLVQVMFLLQNTPAAALALPGLNATPLPLDPGIEGFDLTLAMREQGAGLRLIISYDTALFDADMVQRLAANFQTLLQSIAQDPDQHINRLPLVSPAELRQIAAWNDTEMALPEKARLHLLFSAQARRTPDAIAVRGQGRELTYAELDHRSDQLAGYLRGLGVGPEAVVGLLMPRTVNLAVGMLGILKAGAAYLPLDPTDPPERIAFMLADSAAPVVVTQDDVLHSTQYAIPNTQYVLLDRDWPIIAQHPPVYQFTNLPSPDALAYVIYTSGSAGRPKGVMISHRSVVNHNLEVIRRLKLRPGDRYLQFASLSFDTAVEEMWPAWLCGATVVLRPDHPISAGTEFEVLLEQEQITVLDPPTAFWHVWVAELASTGRRLPPSVRTVFVGGEKVTADKFNLWCQVTADRPDVAWLDGYGPTEATIIATIWEPATGSTVAPVADVPIGRPMANTQVYLLDEELQPVPIGLPGEICIGGVGLARGYLGRPDLTAERFVPNPFEVKAEAEAEEKVGQTSTSASISTSNSRLYRTGDLGRWLPDGNIQFLGRLDRQVKVHGFRVEPGEIEAALRSHPAVREAVVVATTDAVGTQRLVAFVIPDELAPSSGDRHGMISYDFIHRHGLREFLRRTLPDYMVPAHFEVLDALPLTPTNKVDHRALAAHAVRLASATETETAAVQPEGQIEEMLASLWAELLGRRPGRHDDFFALGGHSLLATQLASRIHRAFGVELPLVVLFDAPTLAGMASCIAAALAGQDVLAFDAAQAAQHLATPLAWTVQHPADPARPAPLSLAQQRLWLLEQIEPGSPSFNLPLALRLQGPLDVPALAAALQEIVRRHAVLRTVLPALDGVPQQVVHPDLPVRLTAEPVADETTAQAIAIAETRRPFDLATGPLLRARLLRLAAGDDRQPPGHVLIIVLHHIIADGWSIGVFLHELATLYAAFAGQPADSVPPSPLPPLLLQYADFARWQHAWLEPPDRPSPLAAHLAYWRAQLANLPPLLELPTDRPRPAVKSAAGAVIPVTLPAELVQAVAALGQHEHSTLFMTLLAGLQALLHRYSGQEDIPVGTAVAGRRWPEVEPLIGFFVNTLVLRGRVEPTMTFRQLLAQMRQAVLAAFAHQDVPFEMLVEALQPERNLSHTPLFQVAFTWQNQPAGFAIPDFTAAGLEVTPLPVDTGVSAYDLLLSLGEENGQVVGHLRYSTDLFDQERMERLVKHWQVLLAAAATDPDQPIAQLPLLTDAERHLLLQVWSQGEEATAPFVPAPEVVAAQAAATPNATAVVRVQRKKEGREPGKLEELREIEALKELTYGKLMRRAGQLAHYLRGLGVGLESVVGLMAERAPEMAVGLLGILKAGGAFLPLDPHDPPERIAYMLADSGVQVVVTQESALRNSILRNNVLHTEDEEQRDTTVRNTQYAIRNTHFIFLDRDWPIIAQYPPVYQFTNLLSPDALAYVIYTSGSTGRPKGTLLTHGGLSNLIEAQRRAFGLSAGDRVLQFARLSFDASVWEIFMALAGGSTLVLADQELLSSPDELARVIVEQQITAITLPPTMLALLSPASVVASRLRLVVAAGERCPAEVAQRWAGLPGVCFVNAYGPTETTVCATMHLCAADEPTDPPIGRPLPNFQAYVLDRHLQPVPIGVPGELCLGGVGLARGYLGRPDITAERFVPNPFEVKVKVEAKAEVEAEEKAGQTSTSASTSTSNSRLYRTGDLVRWRCDGTLEYLGRTDEQVKIRGFRVELGEVEAALLTCPGVQEAAVVAHELASGDKRLVAYVVPALQSGRLEGAEAAEAATTKEKTASRDATAEAAEAATTKEETASRGATAEAAKAATTKEKTASRNATAEAAEAATTKEGRLDAGELRRLLARQLPDYMLPTVFVMLEALPRTASGKVDRRALAARGWPTLPEHTAAAMPPPTAATLDNPLAQTLAAIWQQVLGVEQVTARDNFFALGGDSVLAIQAVARAHQAGLPLTARMLFQAPDLASLAAAIAAAQPTAAALSPAKPEPAQEDLPLTPIQAWFFEHIGREPADHSQLSHWNQFLLLEVDGALDATALERALDAVIARHDALRLRFYRQSGRWRQRLAATNETVPLQVVDLTALSPTDQGTALATHISAAQRSLDILAGPLLRVVYFYLSSASKASAGLQGDTASRLLIVVHHLAVDTISWRILLEDLLTAYGQAAAGVPVRFPAGTTSFCAWAQRLAEYAGSADVRGDLAYWTRLTTADAALPINGLADPALANREKDAETVTVTLNEVETEAFLRAPRAAYGAEPAEVLLTALAQALAQWTGQNYALVDVESHGRYPLFDDLDPSRTVGWFTSLYPLAIKLPAPAPRGADHGSPGRVLLSVKEQVRRVPHHGLTYGLLRYGAIGDPGVAGAMARIPEPAVSFNYFGPGELTKALALTGAGLPDDKTPTPSLWDRFRLIAEGQREARSPAAHRPHVLEVIASVRDSVLQVQWTYSRQLHQRATVEVLASNFCRHLRGLITHCLSPDAVGYSPADFPEAGLAQDELDRLMKELA